MNKSSSYSAASVLPAKLIRIKEKCVSTQGEIYPIHIQVCPTNICNLHCSFCSCSKRERKDVLSFEEISSALLSFATLGTRAATITGGGEPCCYPKLHELLKYCFLLGIETGMVTNGFLLSTVSNSLSYLTWCRVSASDDRDMDKLLSILSEIIPKVKIDWAFSYVVTANSDVSKIKAVIEFANRYKMTHVRLVSDLMDLKNATPMFYLKEIFKKEGVDDSKVIYQDRQDFNKGNKRCLSSLLRPLIAPDGFVYPCCGVQYAIKESEGMFPKEMRMCHISEINDFFLKQKEFDGSICDKCYYTDYNIILEKMISKNDHEIFV